MSATFEEWYAKVDRVCQGISGLGIEDLADGPSYDAWESGSTPREYVIDRLTEEGFPL